MRLLFSSAEGSSVQDTTATQRQEQISVAVGCDVINCVGCNTNPPDVRYHELQARCFAAQECTVRKCIGTEINMRKPLCNIGKVATSIIDMYRLNSQNLWIATARVVIMMVELSEQRKQETNWIVRQSGNHVFSKDVLVESIATFTSIPGLASYEIFKIPTHGHLQALMHLICCCRMATTAFTRLFTNVGLIPVTALSA